MTTPRPKQHVLTFGKPTHRIRTVHIIRDPDLARRRQELTREGWEVVGLSIGGRPGEWCLTVERPDTQP